MKSKLGFTLQINHIFNEHIKDKVQEANKCLYVIRCLLKEGYQQSDVDYVFRSIVLSKLTYSLPVYASFIPELTTVQNFLQLCFKRKYIWYQIDMYSILEEVDRSLFKIKISSMPDHLLHPSVLLGVPSSQLPRVNTQHFKNDFFNRLFFKYRVAIQFNVCYEMLIVLLFY